MIEVFDIAVSVSLQDRARAGLAALSGEFAKSEAAAAAFQRRMQGIQSMTMAGAGLTALGIAGVHLFKDFYDAAAKYEQSFARFKALNLGDAVNASADSFARGTRVMGASANDLMTQLTSLHTVLGNYEEAKLMAPEVARMEFANKAVFADNPLGRKFSDKEAQNMAKVIEMRGGFRSPDEMRTQMDFMQHVMSGTSGAVMPADYLGFLKTAGVPGRLMSNREFYYQMEPLIQEQGGNRTGTGLASAYMNLAQGRTTTRAAREIERLGMLVSREMAEFDKHGRLVRIKPGGVVGGDLVGTNPLKFLQETLLPHFAQAGITDSRAIQNEISTVFTNRTAAALYTLIYQQQEKIAKNMAINTGAMGVKQTEDLADQTPQGRLLKFHAAWEDFSREMGEHVLPIITPALESLTTHLKDLADLAYHHQDIANMLVEAGMAMTALAMVGGPILLFGAGLRSLFMPFKMLSDVLGKGMGISRLAEAAFAAEHAVGGLAGALGERGLLGALGPVAAFLLGMRPGSTNAYELREQEDARERVKKGMPSDPAFQADVLAPRAEPGQMTDAERDEFAFRQRIEGIWKRQTGGEMRPDMEPRGPFAGNDASNLGLLQKTVQQSDIVWDSIYDRLGRTPKDARRPGDTYSGGLTPLRLGSLDFNTMPDVPSITRSGGGDVHDRVQQFWRSSPASAATPMPWDRAPEAQRGFAEMGTTIGDKSAEAVKDKLDPHVIGTEIGNIAAATIRSAISSLQINVDGQQLGRVVDRHADQQALRPPTGPALPNVNLGPMFPAHAS